MFIVIKHEYGVLQQDAKAFETHEEAHDCMVGQLYDLCGWLIENGSEDGDGPTLDENHAHVDDVWWDVKEIKY